MRALRSLPPDRARAAERAVERFITNPQSSSLNFRSLRGYDAHFIINARRGDRVILIKTGPDEYEVVDVGPHDNVYRRFR